VTFAVLVMMIRIKNIILIYNFEMVKTKKKTRKIGTRKNTLFKTDHIVFFDDDFERNIQPFRDQFPKIKSILIPPYNTKSYTQILNDKSDFYYPIEFSKKYKDNRYAQYLVKGLDMKHSKNLCNQCSNMTNQGITVSQINKIIKWSNTPSKKERTVLFDLDNTLIICNLILSYKDLENTTFSVEEIAQYISGTTERYDALLLMFFYLRKNGVACKIFTNNGWANREIDEKYFLFFLKLMQVFDPKMKEDDIIFGKRDKIQTFKKNKVMMKMYKK
jgi:hypothetical protein